MSTRSATCWCARPPPAAEASRATLSTRSGSRPTIATSAPRRASPTAAACPMPRVAPVRTTRVTPSDSTAGPARLAVGQQSVPSSQLVTNPVTTSDGRTLAFCTWGDPDGTPVFSLHGTPGSRLGRHPDEGVYRRAGVRVITYDRPGYGESTRNPGRDVAAAASDIAAIADSLGFHRFAVFGGSGGAPHALACGALLPDRVTRCASIVGPAPFGDGGLPRDEWFAGMVEGNVKEFSWALAGEETLRREVRPLAEELLSSVESTSEDALGADYKLSEQDSAVAGRADIRDILAASFREGIGRSLDGLVDDNLAFTQPWGFDPAAIPTPTAVWYGHQDTLVPARHGEWLGQTIPAASVVLMDGGHFAIYDRMSELLAWLTDGRQPS